MAYSVFIDEFGDWCVGAKGRGEAIECFFDEADALELRSELNKANVLSKPSSAETAGVQQRSGILGEFLRMIIKPYCTFSMAVM